MNDSLFLGLDAGGTKTALRAEGGDTVLKRMGPGVNLRRDGLSHTADTLTRLIRDAIDAVPGRPVGGVCAGVAGAADGHAVLERHLREALDADYPIRVTHDADLALQAAFSEGSGVVVIAGTGSVVLGRTARTEDQPTSLIQVGGWGYRLGDDGSGTALGRAALRAVLAALDGGPPTAMTELLTEAHGLDSRTALLDWTYEQDGALADLAPLLLAAADADDWTASSILLRETNALAAQAGWLATQALGRIETRVSVLGGLASEPTYLNAMLGALHRHLPGWNRVPCEVEPVEAAVRVAERLATTALQRAG